MYCFKCGSLRDGAIFCENCCTLRKNIIQDPNGRLNSLIKYYLCKEMAYHTVADVLDACHNIQITLRTLKHKLRTMQLTKSPNITDEAVYQIIKRELRGPSVGHGYRLMWYKPKTTYGIQVRRSKVIKNITRRRSSWDALQKIQVYQTKGLHMRRSKQHLACRR